MWTMRGFLGPFHYLCAALLLGSSLSQASEHGYRENAAHIHGAASLSIAIDGNLLEIAFSAPAINIVGFEHNPGTAEQEKLVTSAIETLKQTDKLFTLPEQAGCSAIRTRVESGLLEAHDHEDEPRGHSDFAATYQFECLNTESLEWIDIHISKAFPANEHIDAQYIFPGKQGLQELKAGHTRLTF